MNLRAFITAGNATFTVTSKRSGNRFTYWVRANEDRPGAFFVSVLTGPDNRHDYSYLGYLRERDDGQLAWAHTKGSKVARTAPSWTGFLWLVSRLNAHNGKGQEIIERFAEVHHEGRCGRCGRALTVPKSIESGFGPECHQKVGLPTRFTTRSPTRG